MTATLDRPHTSSSSSVTARASGLGSSAGLLLLRSAVGAVFIAHGWQKVFVDGLAATTEGFTGMGIPFAAVAAPLAAFTELLAGAAIIVGLLTRLAAAGLAITAAVALIVVHAPNGFFMADGGIEFLLVLAAGALALTLTGAGRLSVDALIRRRRRR